MIGKLCFATNNKNKLAEVDNLLSGKIELISLSDLNHAEDLAEDFFTLEENAHQKAEFIFRTYKVPCFADDTGLEVDALNGEPGVLSARYAGPQKNSSDNIQLLLKNLQGKPSRKAQFRTVMCLINERGETYYFEGKVEGQIIEELRGDMGFGYDPIFVPNGYTQTLAEMSMEEKNKISHRAMAIRKLVAHLIK